MNSSFNIQFVVTNRVAILGIILLFIMAWRSDGFYHPDEHYQLLEYANYKSGLAIKEGLAWEFHDQIRPGLQPFLAYVCMSSMRALGITNPFHLALILRFISGVLSLILIFQTYRFLIKTNPKEKSPSAFLFLSLFLWFAPYLNVRFSSENWSALAFFSGFLILMQSMEAPAKKKIMGLLLSGLLVSLAFQFRYQMAFAALGIMAWLLVYRKLNLLHWTYLFVGALIGLGIGFAADQWLYGSWQFTPYIYFHSNILEGRAATFGVSPWWFYFTETFRSLGLGINMLVFALFFIGLYRSRKHPFTWIFIPFVFGHILVDHKELRFMFPMLIPFVSLVSAGWAAIPDRVKSQFAIKPLGFLLFGINLLLLIYRLKVPSEPKIPFYRFLYQQAQSNTELQTFYYDPDSKLFANSLYGPGNLRMSFYRPTNITLIPIKHPDQMDNFDISKTKNFVINIFPTLPPSRTKNQRLAFKYSAWQFSDLKSFHFFKKTDIPMKIFHVDSR